MKTPVLATLLTSVFLFSAPPNYATAQSTGEQCRGNACEDVSFIFDGCYRIKNYSSKRVKVHMGQFSFSLERGETKVLISPLAHLSNLKDKCVKGFVGNVTARFI